MAADLKGVTNWLMRSYGVPSIIGSVLLAAKNWMGKTGQHPTFDELPDEEKASLLWKEYQRQLGDKPEDTEGWIGSSPDMLFDLYQQFEQLDVENPLENPFDGDFPLTEEEYPVLTQGQVDVLGKSVDEIYRRVDAGEYTWEDATAAIQAILDRVGVPYDSDTLRVQGGLSDSEGLISNRYIITDNPEEAIDGGAGGDMSVEDVLGEVGAPTGGGGGSDAPLGDEDQWEYLGDGVFRHDSGVETYNEDAANNDAYVVGDKYSGPNPTEVPGTVNPSDYPFGGIWIGGVWHPRTGNYEGDFSGTSDDSPLVPGGGGGIGNGDTGGDNGDSTDDDVIGDGTDGTDNGDSSGDGDGTGDGSGTGGNGGNGNGFTPGMLTGGPRVADILQRPERLNLDNIPQGLFQLARRRRRLL